MSRKKILIVAGEPSGDLYASNLVKDLKTLDPDLEFFGIGGGLSKKTGVEIVFDTTDLALVGAAEVLKGMSAIRRAYKTLIERLSLQEVDLAILIDYPGFNLKLAKVLKKRNISVVYYISPQVWAWGENRIKTIGECVKKMIVFFEFEERLYRNYGVDAECVGHPLLDIVKVTMPKDVLFRKYNMSKDAITVALLPGSRDIEVKTLLPLMTQASKIIKEKIGKVQFVIAKHPALQLGLYEKSVGGSGEDIRIIDDETYNILGACDFAVVASGTATLETAIIGTPLLIIYKANLLTFILYKLVSRIRFLGLVNVIAGKEVAPELIQFNATPKKIAEKSIEFLTNATKMASMRNDLRRVKSSLGAQGASLRASRAILPLLLNNHD